MKKNSKKSIIDKYYNEVYRVYLVVANENVKLEDLQKLYIYSDKVELDNRILDGQCTTSDCIDRKTNANVILVKYNKGSKVSTINKELDFINTCSHEAGHVALDIYELIAQNVCFCTPETFCYLIGWATECIYKSLKNIK